MYLATPADVLCRVPNNFSRPSRAGRWVALSLATLILGAGLSSCRKAAPAPKAENAPAVTAPAAPAATTPPGSKAPAAVPEAMRKILGQWLRTDGGYVLELRSAEISGVVEALYFNPNSIHVSRAIWMQGATGLQVVVELTDVGYPGATYVLAHDAQTDRLVGTYTQPQMQQTFEIEFVRQKKP